MTCALKLTNDDMYELYTIMQKAKASDSYVRDIKISPYLWHQRTN